jgi:uncharacterized protein YlxW (UPF0749 family)
VTSIAQRIRAVPTWQLTLGVALLALGFLIAAQLQSQGPRVSYTSQERAPLVETAQGLQAQQDALKAQILALRGQIATLEQQGQGSAVQVGQLNDQLAAARTAAGLIALHGPGLVVQLQDSTNPVPPGDNATDYVVSAKDVRTMVELLWLAGAEAIAVNGERVTGSTAVLDIGGSLLVNSAYQSQPYQLGAIGPADLYARLTTSAAFQQYVHDRGERFGIRIAFAQPPDVIVPAYAGTINLRNARPVPAGSAAAP